MQEVAHIIVKLLIKNLITKIFIRSLYIFILRGEPESGFELFLLGLFLETGLYMTECQL